MQTNRNDEPDPMAATRASGGRSVTQPKYFKIEASMQKTSFVSGGGRGGQPPPKGHASLLFQAAESSLGGGSILKAFPGGMFTGVTPPNWARLGILIV